MNQEQAKQFVDQWIAAWNAHDLHAILNHYADEFEFYSPLIIQLNFNGSGCITNRKDLSDYFQAGLNAYPDLHFKLHNFFVGVNTLVIYYTSVNGRMATEVFQLDEAGKARNVFCNYSLNPSHY